MGQDELAAKVRELKGLKQMAEELAAEIASIEDYIKAEMTARGVSEMLVDVFKVRWTKVLSRRFDTTAFKAKYSELYEQHVKEVLKVGTLLFLAVLCQKMKTTDRKSVV